MTTGVVEQRSWSQCMLLSLKGGHGEDIKGNDDEFHPVDVLSIVWSLSFHKYQSPPL